MLLTWVLLQKADAFPDPGKTYFLDYTHLGKGVKLKPRFDTNPSSQKYSNRNSVRLASKERLDSSNSFEPRTRSEAIKILKDLSVQRIGVQEDLAIT
jgi:hypothetical protein